MLRREQAYDYLELANLGTLAVAAVAGASAGSPAAVAGFGLAWAFTAMRLVSDTSRRRTLQRWYESWGARENRHYPAPPRPLPPPPPPPKK